MDILNKDLMELKKELDSGNLTSKELVCYYLDRIKEDNKSNKPINAFNYIDDKEIIKLAEESDKRIKNKNGGILEGIPIAIKDNINVYGLPTTCSSKILEGFIANYDATVIEKLKSAGMIMFGKTNMDEFAMGSSNENSSKGIVRNPLDRDRVPGGSSGGSAAAVSGGLSPVALGSDTGGSIRQPASFCGVVGLKPTYGTVSRFGLVAYASSLDQIGPIGKTVKDVALIYSLISGYDNRDSTTLKIEKIDINLDGNIKNKRFALPKEYIESNGLDPVIKKAIENVINKISSNGGEIIEVSLPHTEYAIPVYYIVATAEASSNLERFDGIKYGYRAKSDNLNDLYFKTRSEGFGAEVKRRIMLGTYVLSAGYYDAYYLKALKIRTLIKEDFENIFKKADFVIGPTSPVLPFKIGEKINDPISMYLSDIYTISVNLAGLPAISLPCAKTENNLSIGVQLIGKHLDEKNLLNAAYFIEKCGLL